MSSQDSALAFLLAQHTQEQATLFQEESITVEVSMTPKPSKRQAAKKDPPVVQGKAGFAGLIMPDRGTLNARQFMQAMQHAGRRFAKDTNLPYTDQLQVRNDQIKAIHAFYYEVRHGVKVHVGYDPTRDFGSQEHASRMLAMREIKGAPKPSRLPPSRSVSGYVAGVPDMKARQLANLAGQEAVCVEAYIAATKANDECAMLIEQDRLRSIQQQIDALK